MTFLSYGMMENTIWVGMDTLVTVAVGSDVYMEKSFFHKNAKSIISAKGSYNILIPLVLELLENPHWFNSASDLEKYVENNINAHLLERINVQPWVKGKLTTLKIFSWEQGLPLVFEADYYNTEKFTFQKTPLIEKSIYFTNDFNLGSPLVMQNRDYLKSLLVDSIRTYGLDSIESSFVFQSEVARINEVSGIGGETHRIFSYR